MCSFPINIANPNYGKRSGEYKRIEVPCNKCHLCFTRRSNHWFIRLKHQLKEAETAYFVTLTYQHPPLTYNSIYTVKKEDLQNYFKRLRKREEKNHQIKYYAVSEYGEKFERPHYHAIIFNVRDKMNLNKAWSIDGVPIGNIDIGDVEDASIKYVTGYIGKRIGIPYSDDDDRIKEFSLMSKNMGNYFLHTTGRFNLVNEVGYTVLDGIKYSIPRHYKNKLFPDQKQTIITEQENEMEIIIPNPIKQKISKQNYDNFIQNQARQAKNFNSILDWEKNCREIAQRDNHDKSAFISPHF